MSRVKLSQITIFMYNRKLQIENATTMVHNYNTRDINKDDGGNTSIVYSSSF